MTAWGGWGRLEGARERPARGGGVMRGGGGWGSSGWLGREQRQRAEVVKESRGSEREQSRSLTRVLEGKWFTENFSVNRLLKFS